MKIATVLTPCHVAEKCFLSEALDWVAFNRFPLFDSPNGDGDMRFHPDYQEEYHPVFLGEPGTDLPDNDVCARAGLPPNPNFEALMRGEYHKVSETPDYQKKMEAWTEKYKAFIEVPRSELFLALRAGRLQAHGRRLPHPDLDKTIEIMDQKGHWLWLDLESEPIPADFWRQDRINWEESAAKSHDAHYIHIHVNTDQLIGLFPPSSVEDAKSVHLIAGNSFVLDETSPVSPPKTRRSGRPPKNWDAFYLEMFSRFLMGNIPEKQESFIHDMQKWCLKNWGEEPGRSTVLQKVSPFYEIFIRKKSEIPN